MDGTGTSLVEENGGALKLLAIGPAPALEGTLSPRNITRPITFHRAELIGGTPNNLEYKAESSCRPTNRIATGGNCNATVRYRMGTRPVSSNVQLEYIVGRVPRRMNFRNIVNQSFPVRAE